MGNEFKPTAMYGISNVASLGIEIHTDCSYDTGYYVKYALYDEDGVIKGKVKKVELKIDLKGNYYFTVGNGVYYIHEFIRTNLTF